MLESLVALASLAGNAVVAAASTDAWEGARRGIAKLLGRGDPDKTRLAERRLAKTRDQLTRVTGTDGERARSALAAQWAAWLADLLAEHPDAEADLRVLVEEVNVAVTAADHSLAAGGDVSIIASGSGIAAGVIHGPVAGPGGTAIGHLEYQRAAVEGQPVRLTPRPMFLAGRGELLAELDGRLAPRPGEPGPRMVVLSGLGGAGKTSVAVEYAHQHLAEVGAAWQFACEDPAVLAAGFAELAAQLGARELLDTRDPVASVHGVLARFAGDWLLVFDNVADRASMQRLLPPAGRGRVLVTSRDPLWPPGQVLDVPVLDTDVAAGFLVDRTGDQDEQAATELAGELGGLPLALEQAGAYIQAIDGSLAAYLASFRRRRPDMLARGEPTGYDSTVAATWSLAFTELEQSAPQAVGLLRLLACMAPEPVPLRMLLQPRPGVADGLADQVASALVPLLDDELAAGDAMAVLRRYSLVTRAGEGLVLVHRLVQAVTADQMPAGLAGQWRQAAAALIEEAIPADTQLPVAWPECARLLPHARAVLGLTSDGLWRIARYLGHFDSYPAARDLFQLIAGAYGGESAYGPEHQQTLAACAEVARWTGEAGDEAAARDQFAALFPIQERVLGSEHPDTLATRGNLAGFTGGAGNAAAARDQFAVLLPIRERVLGSEHGDTLTTRHDLAFWTAMAGDATGAQGQFAALLPIEERVLGPEHPRTLDTRGDLARFTGEAGDANRACDQLAALLPIRERVSGPEHPDTQAARASLAYWSAQAERGN